MIWVRGFACSLRITLSIIFRSSPVGASAAVICSIVMAILPSATLVAQRHLVDAVADNASHSLNTPTLTIVLNTPTLTIVSAAALFAIFVVLDDVIDVILLTCSENIRDGVDIEVVNRLISRVNEFRTLRIFETPEVLDKLQMAKAGTAGFHRLSWGIFGVGARLVGFLPMVVLLGQVGWWIPIVLTASLVPIVLLDLRAPVRIWSLKERLARLERRRKRLQDILTESIYASDLRLFGVAQEWERDWRLLSRNVTAPLIKFRTRSMWSMLVVAILAGAALFVLFLWAAIHVPSQDGIGSFVMVLSSVVALRVSIWVLIVNGRDIVDAASGVMKWQAFQKIPLEEFRDRPHSISSRQPTYTGDQTSPCRVSMQDVSFRYSGRKAAVLQNFNLDIPAGQSVAIIGRNGAGKSTIVKLLTGLVVPEQGCVLRNGVDIGQLDIDDVREHTAVVAQNFAKFPLSLRENLLMGARDVPDEQLTDALKNVGLEELITLSESPLDAPLTKELPGGIDLSGGQWQRLAIARAAVRARQAGLFIWDEPIAALDPVIEVEFVESLLEMAKGVTSIAISHRLGICTLVDRVIMLDDGVVIEDGTHEELRESGREYARWFGLQSRLYR
jgi:ATP-binding cassette subfamily B protein